MTQAQTPPPEETALTVTIERPSDLELALTQHYMPRLEELLAGTDITPARFVGMTVQAAARDAKLLAPDVDRKSLLLAVLTVAEMGLAPTGAFGGAWLVPYYDKNLRKKRVQAITDWRGFIKMAFRSGQLRGAWARLVYEGEYFEVQQGTEPKIAHNYALERDPSAKVTHAYAVAHLITGEKVFEVMTHAELEAVRARARADEGPWKTDWGEMARKTVVRRLFKYVPVAVTPALAAALASEDEWEQITAGPQITQAAYRPTDRRAKLLEAVGLPIPPDGTDPDAAAAAEQGAADEPSGEAEAAASVSEDDSNGAQ